MQKLRLLLWLLIAWPLPALIAGALGWRGIWGSGSALADYLIPLPVAGGALHIPSFAVATTAVLLLPQLGMAGAARARALLFGMALAGLLFLLNLQFILAALQAGSALPARLWDPNPLGLFLLSDALLALLFTAGVPRRSWRPELPTAALLLLPALLPFAMVWPHASREAATEFTVGIGQYGEQRGDDMTMVHTRLDPAAPDFRARAEAWVLRPQAVVHPRFHVTTEDQALLFTRDVEASRRFGRDKVEATLCVYEDGAPLRWLPGLGDCFSGHESFSDRLARALSARPADEPAELRRHLAAAGLCAQYRDRPVPPEQALQLTHAFVCEGLPRERERLRQQFPGDSRLEP